METCDQSWPKAGPNVGRCRPNFGQTRPTSAKCWSSLVQVWPTFVERGRHRPISVDDVQMWPRFWQRRPEFGQHHQIRTTLGRTSVPDLFDNLWARYHSNTTLRSPSCVEPPEFLGVVTLASPQVAGREVLGHFARMGPTSAKKWVVGDAHAQTHTVGVVG